MRLIMNTRLDNCDPERLRLLAEDRLPPTELVAFEQHLDQCPQCRDLLDRLVGDDRCLGAVRRHFASDPTNSHEEGPAAVQSLDFLAPSDWHDSLGRLGTYEVKGVLGCGGMGVVLKAFDPALSRNVAIKVMSASLASCGAARQRFLREARAAAAVVHEHVVAVFAVVEAAGLPFLVMEYVPGRSLQDRLDKHGPLSLPEVLRIGMQTSAGLAAAHAQGLVHRDVKPANILLEDGVERVRLTDFGLARAAADAAMTHSGMVAGTPHYMAPEQARGETTDHRADLFSLGSTLYAICAGHPPFRAENPLAVLRRVSDDEPRPLRAINPDVPAWLEAIIARLMAKDPSRRFQTATEVADLLSRCLAHVQQPLVSPLPVGFERPPTWPVRRRRFRPSRAVMIVSVTTVVAAVAIAFRSPWMARDLAPGGRAARSGSMDARDTPDSRPDRVGDEVQRLLDRVRDQTRAIEADLLHRGRIAGRDTLGGLSSGISGRAKAVEHEILSGRLGPADGADSAPNPHPHDRR
jgi:serine/threonine protein kinase